MSDDLHTSDHHVIGREILRLPDRADLEDIVETLRTENRELRVEIAEPLSENRELEFAAKALARRPETGGAPPLEG